MFSNTSVYNPLSFAHEVVKNLEGFKEICDRELNPILRSITGPTTKGPIPILSSLNLISACFVAKQ